MNSPVESARSFLFVPASRPDRFEKALDSGADCVILDLEDAVPAEQKATARTLLGERLSGFSRPQLARTLVRVNAAETPSYAQDLRLASDWVARGLAGIVVPKAEAPASLRAAGVALGPHARLVPLIESLAGLDAAGDIARVPQVVRLAFGHLDFQLDLGMRCDELEMELASVRFALVAYSRRAQRPPPIDGVTATATDSERLLLDVRRARSFGFSGKLCIHPSQVRQVNEAFSPSAAEMEWAARVIEGARSRNGEAFSLDGRMVDLPVLRQAERTIKQGTVPERA